MRQGSSGAVVVSFADPHEMEPMSPKVVPTLTQLLAAMETFPLHAQFGLQVVEAVAGCCHARWGQVRPRRPEHALMRYNTGDSRRSLALFPERVRMCAGGLFWQV